MALRAFISLLSAASETLTSFDLVLDRSVYSGEFLNIVAQYTPKLKKLEKLRLSHTTFQKDHLICFLKICPENLKSLKFEHINVYAGTWHPVFAFILQNFDFNEFFLNRLNPWAPCVSLQAIHRECPTEDMDESSVHFSDQHCDHNSIR